MPRINIGTITLNYAVEGTGEALLFIPGLIGLHSAWDYQIAHFSKSHLCISFDHRGAGRSDKPVGRENYSTGLVAQDVVGLLDALGVEKVTAVGTSTGGCVVQNLALDHPDRLERCIFCNTWTKADIYIHRLQTLRKWIAQSHGADAYVEFSSILTNGAMQFRYDLDRVLDLESRAKETIGSIEVIAARVDMTLTHDRLAELGRIDHPSLVIGTKDDVTVPAYFAEDIHAAIRESRLVILPDGGHYSYRRYPEQWNAIVGEFLADTRQGAG